MRGASVVLALADPTESASALPVARAFAALTGGVIRIVHATDEQVIPSDLILRLELTPTELEGVVLEPRTGAASDEVLRAASELRASFIVLGEHTVGYHGEEVIGHTALAVLRESPCPVVLVRPDGVRRDWELRSVLVGHDGKPATSAAVASAAGVASAVGALLEIAHVAGLGAAPSGEPGSLSVPRYLDQPQHEWPSWTSEFVRRFLTESAPHLPRVRLTLLHGDPGEGIVRRAREGIVDLIVIAWRGDWSDPHAATVKSILRATPCPVMLVRTDEGAAQRSTEGGVEAPRDGSGSRPQVVLGEGS